ncbi:MAG: TonB-dependent receptor, partial [Spirochaetaceae bacterium]|nr:TonB-dependent receptor [Spirochaetaceae bacterium]
SLRTRQEFSSNLRYYGEGFLGWDSPSVSLSLRGGFDWDGGRISPQRNLMGQAIDFYEVPANRMGNLRANAAWRHGGGDIEVFGFWNDSVLRSSSDLTSGYEYSNARLGGGLSHSWRLGDTALLDGFFTYTQLDYNAEKQDYTFATASADASNFFRDMEGELRFSWEPLISHALLFGVNAKREALESVDFDEEKSLIQVAAFVQDTWNVGARDRFRIVPGLRFDYRLPNSAEEEPVFKLTPKLSLRFDPAERLILRLSYGMGFKAPTLKQNYWVFWHPAPNNWLILGNPALRPETSHGFNAQADYAPWPGFTLSAAGYFNYIVDKIETLADENAGSALNSKTGALQAYTRRMVYSNVGKALTTGGDLSLRFAGERLSLSGVYSIGYAGAYDETEKKYLELPSMTAHQVNLNAAWRIPVLEATAALRLTWHTPRLLDVSDSNGRMRTPDYLMAHLRVSKLLFGERLEVYGAVQNLLNNTHFITGSGGSSQRDYYGLLDGVIFTLGGSLRR